MSLFGILALVLGLVSTIGTIGLGAYQAVTNKKAVEETNETNLQAVRETNATNVEQAELAYQRSLPTQQVKNLMDAGMSRAGALSALTGGGTYTAPVLQSAHADAPQMDLSGVFSGLDRLQNIPSNVEQAQLVGEQRHALEVDTQNKINADNRAQEQHEFDMWQKLYGKDALQKINTLSSDIVSKAANNNINLDSIDSVDKLVKAFDLGNNEVWLSMPHAARNEVLQGVRTQAAENRAREQQNNANQAAKDAHQSAKDAHDINQVRLAMEKINLKYLDKEKKEQLLNIMRIGEGYIQDNNIKFADLTAKNMENFVREAGIDSEAEAHRLGEEVKKLANMDEENMQRAGLHATKFTREGRSIGRLILRDFGELLMKVKFGN